MIEVYNKYKCSIIAIEEIPKNEVSKYGIISGNLIDNSDNIYYEYEREHKIQLNDTLNF